MKFRKELIDETLSQTEKDAIQAFIDNKTMSEAVKKVLLFGVYNNGTLEQGKEPNPLVNFALGLASGAVELKLSHEQLGKHLSVAWEGIQVVENCWDALALYRKESVQTIKKNPAR